MICFHNNTSPPALPVPPPPSPCFTPSEPTKPPARGTRPWRGQDPRYHVSGATRALPHCSSWPGFWVRACSCQHGTEDGVPQVSPWTDPAPAAVRDFVQLFSSRMMHTYGCYPSPCWSWWQGSRMQHPLLSALLPTFHLRSANSTHFPSTLPFLTYGLIPIAPDSSTLVALGYLFFWFWL